MANPDAIALLADDDAVSFGPLADHTSFMLRLAQLRAFDGFFAEFGTGGVRPGQLAILVVIACNPDIRQGVLADALSIKWSNMAKIIRRLDRDGLIERRVPASDRRAIELRLTRAGHDFVDRLMPTLEANDRATTAALSEAERRTLMHLLAKLIGRPAGPGDGG